MQQTAYISTPIGIIKIVGDNNGVSIIKLETEGTPSIQIAPDLQTAATQLQEYFHQKRTHFTFKLNPAGTPFQQKVWFELLAIPFGKTISYLTLAKKLGDAKVIRAAATANGKNPLFIVVPCHRVIGSNGALTGFSAGLWCKKWLLEHETPSKQQQLF